MRALGLTEPRPMLAFLRRLLWVGAWACLLVLGGLWAYEANGMLARSVRARLARELGPLGERLRVERAALRWFEPGLVLEGVALVSDSGSEPELELDRVHVSFTPRLTGIREVRVEGGRLRASPRLLEDWNRVRDLAGIPPGAAGAQPVLPSCALSGLQVSFELPDRSFLALGTLDLLARPRVGRGFDLAGRVTPALGSPVSPSSVILASGDVDRTGLRLRASMRDALLSARDLPLPMLPEGPPLAELSARLSLDSGFELTFAPGMRAAPPRATLRASIAAGRVLRGAGGHPWEDVQLELEARFEPQPGGAFFEREAWEVRARGGGRWQSSPVEAWAEFGRALADKVWLHAWARARGLSLDPSSLGELGLERHFAPARAMLDPRGSVDLAGVLTATRDPELGWRHELGLHGAARGGLGIAYQGVPHDPHSGLPMPVTGVQGDFLFASRPQGAPGWRLAAVDLSGEHGSGRAEAWVRIAAPDVDQAAGTQSGTWHPDLDIVLSTSSLAVDERLRQALEANHHLTWLWPAFSPSGGAVATDWRLRAGADVGGFSAAGHIRLQGVGLRWGEVPVPLENVEGEVSVLWAPRPVRVQEDPLVLRRAFGVSYRLDNTGEPRVGAQASARGWVREESPARIGAVGPKLAQEIALDIDALGLRGRDFDVLATRFPALGRQVEELGARGRMRVAYAGGRPRPALPFTSTIEATPLDLELTPRVFQRRTKEVQGRVLIATTEDPLSPANLSQFSLAGKWPDGAELTARGLIPGTGEARVHTFGSGIDPANTAFKGALITTLSESSAASQGMDLSAWRLAGPVDFAVEALFDPAAVLPAQNRTRFYLRDNDLASEDLRLQDLHGTFEQDGETLQSPLVRATLAGHPIELHDVRAFPLAAVGRVRDADPWLLREGFWKDPNGRALQADVLVRDMPLDAEHLAGLVSEEILAGLRENEHWRGAIDLLGARLLVVTEPDDHGKVAVRGRVRPHDLATRLGIPIAIEAADVRLEELVLESGRLRGWARIANLDALVAERALADASMIAGYVDGRLTIDNLSGEFEGGRLESLGGAGGGASKALGIDLSAPYRFDVAVRLQDVGVAGLLRGVFQSSIADEGVLDASLQLSGTPGETLALTGRGSLSLDEGSLWSIPVMRELFGQLGFDRTGLFDRLRARFELREGRVRISHVEIQSDLLDLVGRGWQDLDGRLAYDLEVRYGLLDRLGPLNRVLYWLNNNLWRVAVRGDFGRPRVAIRNALLELLRDFEGTPERTLPLPPFSSLGPRF